MFSLREYLSQILTLPCGAVDEIAVSKEIARVYKATQSWGKELRLKQILFELRISL